MKERTAKGRKIIGAAAGLIVAAGVTVVLVSGSAPANISDEGNKALGGREIRASVTSGKQIYKCVQQSDGGFAFKHYNVTAQLDRDIKHSFVSPASGPPQWIAPDGSAVTGKTLSSTPNGKGNIPELKLAATQSGEAGGLLSNTVKILRLNTVGGVAPSGPCDPDVNPTVAVPYQADYVFIQKP